MIYLVSVDPFTEKQTHMEWPGHSSLEEAKKEFAEMRQISISSRIPPLDGYVYEADKPEYGNVSEKLDVEAFSKYSNSWAQNQIQRQF